MSKELELYELVLLMRFTSTEHEIMEKVDYYRDLLTTNGSEVMVKSHGKKPLAYTIDGCDTATYVQLIYLGNGQLVKTINKAIQRDNIVLRAVTSKIADHPEFTNSTI
tara:strand:+ start:129 stop:452 length:324 start_codon:yes stop_codon:yes gene_type:complete